VHFEKRRPPFVSHFTASTHPGASLLALAPRVAPLLLPAPSARPPPLSGPLSSTSLLHGCLFYLLPPCPMLQPEVRGGGGGGLFARSEAIVMPLRRPLPGVVVGREGRVGAVGDTCAGGCVVRWMRVRRWLVVGLWTCVTACAASG